jgi:hypothetical protein
MTGLKPRAAVIYALRFPLTTVAATFAVLVTGVAALIDINVIDLDVGSARISRTELDELVIAWALVFTAYGVDLVTRKRKRLDRLQAEQLRVVHVTMRTVQDIVGHCHTELHVLRKEAEGVVPAEALAIFDASIRVTDGKLAAIEELKRYFERRMAMGLGPDTERGGEKSVGG